MSDSTVLVLFFSLVGLTALLIFLYKKLNREGDGEYSLRRIVYKKGGVRDRVRGVALVVERHLGVQLWPRGSLDEDGNEMQDIQGEEIWMEQCGCRESDTDKENEEDDLVVKSEREEDVCSSEEGEQEENSDTRDGKEEEDKERPAGGGGIEEESGGAGLIINLSQFSGSVIWSGEDGGEGNVTAL